MGLETLSEFEVKMYCFYRRTGIKGGFFERYFHHQKEARTNFEAFNTTNDEFFELFGEFKYSNHSSFRVALKNHLKK